MLFIGSCSDTAQVNRFYSVIFRDYHVIKRSQGWKIINRSDHYFKRTGNLEIVISRTQIIIFSTVFDGDRNSG